MSRRTSPRTMGLVKRMVDTSPTGGTFENKDALCVEKIIKHGHCWTCWDQYGKKVPAGKSGLCAKHYSQKKGE